MTDKEFYREIVELLSSGKRAVVATVVRTRGSTPREVGAKLLLKEDGQVLGTVGGGVVEAAVVDEARKVLLSGKSRLLDFRLDGTEDPDTICGGDVSIFVEILGRTAELIILGAGHLGQALAQQANFLHFSVVVVDDREEFANSNRFPEADEVIVQPFEEFLQSRTFSAETNVVVVTRGHELDALSLRHCLGKGAGYLGMIGSRRKVLATFEELRKDGYEDALEDVHAPIGLDIGARTPEEIALSIMAEIIAVRSGQAGGFMKDAF